MTEPPQVTVRSSGHAAPRLVHSLYDRKVKVGDRLVLSVKGQLMVKGQLRAGRKHDEFLEILRDLAKDDLKKAEGCLRISKQKQGRGQ